MFEKKIEGNFNFIDSHFTTLLQYPFQSFQQGTRDQLLLCLSPHRWHRPHRPTWHISTNLETAPRPLQGPSWHPRALKLVAVSRLPSAAWFAPGRWRRRPWDQCYSAWDDRNENRAPAKKKERLDWKNSNSTCIYLPIWKPTIRFAIKTSYVRLNENSIRIISSHKTQNTWGKNIHLD